MRRLYKGYRIIVDSSSPGFSAVMVPQAGGFSLHEIAYATTKEGEDIALQRAHQIIEFTAPGSVTPKL